MLAYVLPTGENKRVLWVPGPQRFAWGELRGLSNKLIVLSPDPNLDISDIPLMVKDNVHRPTVRMEFSRRPWISRWVGRLQLWGLIWLLGITKAQLLEDLIGGIYLLLGLPLFMGLQSAALNAHRKNVLDRFNTLFYAPNNVKVVYSRRLQLLEELSIKGGAIETLAHLDELGFGHLREFYRRVAWSTRWEVGPPTGAGTLECN